MIMTKTESLVRSILDTIGFDVRPLSCAIEVSYELLFSEHIPMDDILVTKDVYPVVARRLGKKSGATARAIERLANSCWEALAEKDLVVHYIGRPIKDIRAPRDIIFYLAFYLHYDMPFFQVLEHEFMLHVSPVPSGN